MISEYYKCDLHIHTDSSKKTKENDYFGNFSVEKIINEISKEENNIKMFSFTDHNIINVSAYREYNENYKTPDRKLFVGVELDIVNEQYIFDKLEQMKNKEKVQINKYHSLIIFKNENAKLLNDKLDELYKEISLEYNSVKKNAIDLNGADIKCRVTSFNRFVKKFIGYEYLVISHGNKKENICEAYKTYKENITEAQGMILLGFINSLEMTPGSEDVISHFNDGFDKILREDFSGRKDVPYVIFSDNHEIDAYPYHDNKLKTKGFEMPYTWLKGDLSFESLRLSFVDPESRIFISKEEPNKPSKYLEKIHYTTISPDGIEKEQDISFSPGINTIIGGRSSGKSLLFNAILESFVCGKKNRISDYTKDKNQILKKESISAKMNFSNEFKFNNICDLKFYTQEEIIEKYSNNGHGLKETLDFKDISKEELENNKKNISLLFKNLSSVYSDFFKNKDTYNINVICEDLIISSLAKEEKYEFKNILKKIIDDIEDNSESILEIFSKINKQIAEMYNIKEIKFSNNSNVFSEEELQKIDQFILMLLSKKQYLKEYYNSVFIKEKYVEKLLTKLEAISNLHMTKEDIKIENAIKNINSEKQKIKTYFLSKLKLKKISSSIEDINVKFEPLTVKISDYYTLNTQIDVGIDYNLINNIFLDKIKDYDGNISFFDNIHNLICGKSNIKYKGNSVSDFNKLINDVENELLLLLEPKYRIVEKEKGSNRDISSDNMSSGKKASIYLEIILEESKKTNDIILIDQPEDNIDNEFISDVLIEKIRNLRMSNQIILVTHNASIAINSDSENIIIAENEKGLFTYIFGGIEDINHRQKACKLLDGGNYIFDNRYHKYNILNRKIYEPLRIGEKYNEES